MSDSINAVANTAMAKAETIDSHTNTIAQLTKMVTELTVTNKNSRPANRNAEEFVNPRSAPQHNNTSSAIPAITPAPAPATQTSHMVNTTGVMCPVKLQPSRCWHFARGKRYSHCRKKAAKCGAVAQRGADRRVDDAFALPQLDVPPPLPLGVLQWLDVLSRCNVPLPLPLGVLLRIGVVPRRDVVPRQLWAQRGH